MSRPADLVRALVLVADDLDERGYAGAGVVRWAARELMDGTQHRAADGGEGGCRRCGEPIEQKARGRPRQWCSDRCRRGGRLAKANGPASRG